MFEFAAFFFLSSFAQGMFLTRRLFCCLCDVDGAGKENKANHRLEELCLLFLFFLNMKEYSPSSVWKKKNIFQSIGEKDELL